tara:strand:- start:617 stop:790 length:174 start_codon:yes stop_codon:yes gene_type:complete
MKKEFEIEDILKAVNTISKIEGKKGNTSEIKEDNTLKIYNEVKSKKSDILVLDEMIE